MEEVHKNELDIMRSIWGGDLGPKFCPNWR